MRRGRLTSFSERKNVVLAAILALLPGVLTLAVLVATAGSVWPGVIWAGLGMLYVERWFYASVGYAAALVVGFLLLLTLGPNAGLVAVALVLVYQLVLLPVWAVKRAREYNELADELEAVQAHK